MKFSEKIQVIRRERGMSQEELAEMLGVSRQSVSKWESGKSYPETEKIIEICQMFGVTTDSLLLGGDGFSAGEGSPEGYRPKKKKSAAARTAIALLAVVVLCAAAVRLLSPPSPKADDVNADGRGPSGEAPIALNSFDRLKEYYFDFAIEHRLDYVPFFSKGEALKDSTQYLFFAFAVNLEGWGDDKGNMTKQYIDDTVFSYFGVSGLNHLPLRKAWDFDGEKYIAYPQSIKEAPIYALREYRTWEEEGTQYHLAVLDCYSSEYVLDSEQAKADVLMGDLGEMTLVQTEEICYTTSIQSFGAPQFVWHTVKEQQP